MSQIKIDRYAVVDLCLLAGKILLQSGAETYRVEDTMMRMAASCGLKESHSFVMPTGIMFSTDGDGPTKLTRITDRTTDLHKVAEVNDVSRKISAGILSVSEAHQMLMEIDQSSNTFPKWFQVIAAAIASGCFLVMFQGQWQDFVYAVVAGGLGFIAFLYFHPIIKIKFFSEFLASVVIGAISLFFVSLDLGQELDKIITE
ncbi:threonine/serine exporter family protein [Salinibacillus xinjiangensis]|uniref:Threonine/serine exporter n=1 Tax=Salinibacillus xinjiangensis TaxID=1229268 RepID=A0A6G1X5T9_9BACI|nr:threonine/serine exporter family protein [Salinibacillus xinjiangensis]MRG86334.1 threonine/serine exporter [Salinibacillus xinjiangensis]